MRVSDIIEVIKNDKRFSGYNFVCTSDYLYTIECIIGETTYKILVEEKSNYKLNFVCDLYRVGVSDIIVVLSRINCSEKYILAKFSEVIKYLKKVNFFISKIFFQKRFYFLIIIISIT